MSTALDRACEEIRDDKTRRKARSLGTLRQTHLDYYGAGIQRLTKEKNR